MEKFRTKLQKEGKIGPERNSFEQEYKNDNFDNEEDDEDDEDGPIRNKHTIF